jgi:transketolase
MKKRDHKIKELAKLIRYFILKSTTVAGSGHPSSSLSATDLMATLFFGGFFRAHLDKPEHPTNDRLIFSKGHASPLFYSLYAAAQQLTEKELMTLRKFDSELEGHPTMKFPFTEAATGSLGQGLAVGFGMALNAKYLDRMSYRTFVLLGDSEMAEGSVWETMQLAAYYELNNLVGIIDVNGLGQRGQTMFGHSTHSYAEKARAFGWRVIEVDGHNIDQIEEAYHQAFQRSNKPVMIIAKTVKGKGVKFIENKEGWHGRALSGEECEEAILGLGEIEFGTRGIVARPAEDKPEPYKGEVKIKHTIHKKGDMIATRTAYGHGLVSAFPHYRNMVVLDAEVSNSTYSAVFNEHYPERFFEMFIAEQNMVGAALGLSRRGKIPFVSTFAAFFTRAADQIRMTQYSNSNIKFVGSHVGVSIGEDGASQMGLEDIALFRSQIGSVVLYPSDAVATEKLVLEAAKHFGNVYMRTTRGKTEVLYDSHEKFTIGGSKTLKESDDDEATIVAAGVTLLEALKAHDMLLEERIKVRVIDLYSIKPLDESALHKAARETKLIITVEDHFEAGGLGEAVTAAVSATGADVHRLCVRKMPQSGEPHELLSYEEIDANAIVKKIKRLIKK